MELLHGGLQQFLGCRFDMTEVTDFGWPHFGIAGRLGSLETFELALACRLNTLPDRFGGLDLAFVGQFFIIDTRNFDMNIDTIEQRATETFLIARNGRGGTGAFFDGI